MEASTAVRLLGGLAVELQIVDSSSSGTTILRELASLVRLLASSSRLASVKEGTPVIRLWDLATLLEDAWLRKESPSLLTSLAKCRLALMRQVSTPTPNSTKIVFIFLITYHRLCNSVPIPERSPLAYLAATVLHQSLAHNLLLFSLDF